MYYINDGKIAMIQKASHTSIKDLRQDVVFGEIGVLSGGTRSLTARARDFTNCSLISGKDLF